MFQGRAKAAARRLLVGGMEASGVLPAVRRRTEPQRAVILRYHSVSPFDAATRLYRSGTIAVSPATFERQMRFLAQWYQVVPLSRVVDCLDRGEAFPHRAVAITFDDGYRDNFVHALPVLRSFGFQATVYVATGAIGDGWRFWLARVRACILRSSRSRIDLESLGQFDVSSDRERETAVNRLTRQLKLLTSEERASAIERIAAETGITVPVQGSNGWFMDWDQLREMAAGGIEIGAHTHTHPILTRLSDESADSEIRKSRDELERGLGRPVHHFAYPNGGGVVNHDARIVGLVRAAGFRSASTSIDGVLRLGADPFRLRRLGIAERQSLDGFAFKLERDRVFSFGRQRARPRLLLVGPPPDAPGGISTCVRTVLGSTIGSQFEITHLSPTGAHAFHQPKVLAFLRLVRAMCVLSFLMLFRRPAIAQIHTAYGIDFWRGAPFVLLSRAVRIPNVLIIHGSRFDRAYQDAGRLQRAGIRFVLRQASAIHVRGQYWRDVLLSIEPRLPVYVLPTTTEPVDEVRVDAAMKWSTPVVLFVGGMSAIKDNVRKGLPDLLAIVPSLVAQVPEAKIQIVGPDSGDPWKKLFANATGHVEFLGSLTRKEIREVYRKAAVFVLPSHAEGMPNAILEAMAHGLPVVATSVGSVSEVVEHGRGGYLLPPGDKQQLLDALVKLLKDPESAMTMGEHNRAVVRDGFTNRHTADRLLASYATVLSGERRSL